MDKDNFDKRTAYYLQEIAEMLIEKNRRYGNSALQPSRIFSNASETEQILVRIDDKLSRVKAAGGFNKYIVSNDEDVINDLIGYLVLLKLAYESKN